MKSSEAQSRFTRVLKTFVAHLVCLMLLPILAWSLMIFVRSFVLGNGLPDFQSITVRAYGELAHSFATGRLDAIYQPMAYAAAVALVSILVSAHRFWHVLALWFVFYLPVAYVISDQDVAWSFYVVFVAPLTGIAALCAWLFSRRFWRPST